MFSEEMGIKYSFVRAIDNYKEYENENQN